MEHCRSCGPHDDQQRAVDLRGRRCRRRDPRLAAAAGKGWRSIGCSKSSFTPMASPECIAAVGAQARPKARAARHPSQNRINPSDDWWQQWFADNGVPADEAILRRPGSGSRTRPTKAMRRWPGWGLPADSVAVEGRCCRWAALRAVPRPHFGPRLGLLAGLSEGTADGAQSQAFPRMAVAGNAAGIGRI